MLDQSLLNYLSFLDQVFEKLKLILSKEVCKTYFFNFYGKRNDLYKTFTLFYQFDQLSGSEKEYRKRQFDESVRVQSQFLRTCRSVRFFLKAQIVYLFLFYFTKKKKIKTQNLFFSLPTLKEHSNQNRIYGKFPDELSKNQSVSYLSSILADGYYTQNSISDCIKIIKKESKSKNIVFLETHAHLFLPTFMILKSIKFFLQYMSLQSALEKLDDQTKVVFSEEIEMTLQRLLHFYYIEKISISAQSWVKADRIFYFLFEHLMGRAVFSSWKLSSKLVGVQHGTYSIGRLGQYLSLSEVKDFDYPEVVVSEGEGQRFFLNLFRPDLRVEKLGALRSDVFFNSLKTIKKDSDINKNSKCGLVVLGLHENKDLLKIVADSSVKDELCWVIKFHPKSTNDQKSQIKAKLNHKNVEFLSESIVDFSRFDFCIFFDSSLGVECFELGIPTMSCKSSERVECLSPFSKSFLQSSGADHFHIQNRIDLLNSLIEYDQHKSKIEKDWFFSNKGKALNYWLEYFLDESN